MTVSKEILHITLILLPGIVSFLITEALIPHKQAEFNRSVIYVITLSAMSFLISLGIWNFYSYLSIKLKFAKQLPFLELKENIFSFHSNYEFAILVFFISMVIGLFFAWAINNKGQDNLKRYKVSRKYYNTDEKQVCIPFKNFRV